MPPSSGLRSRSLYSLALTCSPNVFAQILYVALRCLAVFVVVRHDVICDRWMGEENDGRALIRAQAGSRRTIFGQSVALCRQVCQLFSKSLDTYFHHLISSVTAL